MTANHSKQTSSKPLSRGLWWGCFILATYMMSLWFQTFKSFTLAPNLENGLAWLGVMGLLVMVVLVLSYDSYVQEKGRERIQKPVWLFEWMIQKRFLLKGDLK